MSKPVDSIDEALLDYATDENQVAYIRAVNEHQSISAAARALGVDKGLLARTLKRLKIRAVKAGYAPYLLEVWNRNGRQADLSAADLKLNPHEFQALLAVALEDRRQDAVAPAVTPGFVVREVSKHYADDGALKEQFVREGPAPLTAPLMIDEGDARDGTGDYVISGVSTFVGPDGSTRGQWVKTRLDLEARLRGINAALAKKADEVLPRLAPMAAPALVNADLLNLYVFTDYHLGMRAWREEGGADWDLSIAEDLIVRCFSDMVAKAPAAETGFIAQLGDFLHFDGLLPVTPTSRHVLDAAAHYEAVVDAAIRIMQRLVDFALQRHSRVVVLAAEGNHDIAGSMWMRPVLRALYRDEPRLHVVQSVKPYYAFEFGKTMLGFHHGHLRKKEQLPAVFADLYDEMWGRTKKRYAHAGHYHHEVEIKQEGGMKIIQHPTLAPNDSHSARGGYSEQGRQAVAITYHKQFGKAWENVVTPEMLGPQVPLATIST